MRISYCITLGLALSATVSATAAAQGPPAWSLGAVGFAYRSPFEAENTNPKGNERLDYNAFPYIAYRGERFYVEGLEAGLHAVRTELSDSTALAVDVLANVRTLPGFSRSKLSGDAGARMTIESPLGTIDFTALHDITDTSNGTELRASYGYTISMGTVSLTPSVGVAWMDRKMANYMWGVSTNAHERMLARKKIVLPAYEISESIINYDGTLVLTYTFGNSWTILSYASSTLISSTIRENPGINKDFDITVGLGLAYNF